MDDKTCLRILTICYIDTINDMVISPINEIHKSTCMLCIGCRFPVFLTHKGVEVRAPWKLVSNNFKIKDCIQYKYIIKYHRINDNIKPENSYTNARHIQRKVRNIACHVFLASIYR